MEQKILTVVGGDFRSAVAANQLAKCGKTVRVFGFDDSKLFTEKVTVCKNIKEATEGVDFIILPLPCSADEGTNIHTPLYSGSVSFRELLQKLPKNCFVLGGMLHENIKKQLAEKEIFCADYFTREEFAVKNAVPTAEGAIEAALRETPFTLHDASCLITGFGRIAKLLTARLQGFGAKVSVCARKVSDLAWIEAIGCESIEMKQLKENLPRYDLVFNTVPHTILTEDLLHCVKDNCLLIDLASKPGGIDFETAQKLGLNVIWALSLPGKCAPLTAGKIICDTVLNMIKEQEEEKQ